MPKQEGRITTVDSQVMKNHQVHLYALVHVTACNVQGTSMLDAINKAEHSVDLSKFLGQNFTDNDKKFSVGTINYADITIHRATVEEISDKDEQSLSKDFHFSRQWLPGKDPRVLVIVRGGVADYVADGGVEVNIFDHDNFESDPLRTEKAPEHFADLASPFSVPTLDLHKF